MKDLKRGEGKKRINIGYAVLFTVIVSDINIAISQQQQNDIIRHNISNRFDLTKKSIETAAMISKCSFQPDVDILVYAVEGDGGAGTNSVAWTTAFFQWFIF